MKGTIISVVIVVVLIGGATMLGKSDKQVQIQPQQVEEGGMSIDSQVVEINAKGGYTPRVVSAKAGVSTKIKVTTRGTFDCSSALTIPSIGYRANLPPSGVTEIEVPPQSAGTSLQGICQMGMYYFAINFN
ncbi:MAG TPA: cupredoxin domain-containing protein [Candidatus Paceibacterota bacterium]|nr:cupredoxin domain-containing protein [Candidatus Paceibacterota bacterium]